MAPPRTPAPPGIGMTSAQAETWVIVAAVATAGIYAYRRIADPAAPTTGKLKNVVGQGTPVPTGQFITAWGTTFLIVSIMAEADPGLGGGFALLILLADALSNAQTLFGDVSTAEGATTTKSGKAVPPAATGAAGPVTHPTGGTGGTGGTGAQVELPEPITG